MGKVIFIIPIAVMLVLVLTVLISYLKNNKSNSSFDDADALENVQFVRSGSLAKIIKIVILILIPLLIIGFLYFFSMFFFSPISCIHNPQTSTYSLQPITQNIYVYRHNIGIHTKGHIKYNTYIEFAFNGKACNVTPSSCPVYFQSANERPTVIVKKYAYSNPVLNFLYRPCVTYEVYASKQQVYDTVPETQGSN